MRILLLLLVFCFMVGPVPPVQARTETIAMIVNDDAVSMSDVNDRMKLIMVSSGLPNTQEIRAKVMPQVINSLVDEQLKLQEAARLGIEITQEEIDQGFLAIAAQNDQPPERFKTLLGQSGINVSTMERQIMSQVAWSQVIQSQMRPKVIISDKDIDDAIKRLVANEGTQEYLVAEIFLPVDDPKSENDTRQLAGRLVQEVKGGKAPFFKVAQQFSKAAGATQGGDLGWVQKGQLPEELDVVLQSMKKEQISQPVRSPGGYHILYLRDFRLISSKELPPREQIMSNLGIRRLDLMQRRYLMDLKAAAFIENRVEF